MPPRLIFIGDIHGCIDELRDLLERVAPAADDVVVSLGDTINKGPDPVGVVELLIRNGYAAIRGNKENELLAHSHNPLRRFVAREGERAMLHRHDLVDAIAEWPLWIDFPQQRVLAVHGGVLPVSRVTDAALADQSDTLPTLRYVRRTREGWSAVPKGKQRQNDRYWIELWEGDRTVLYGHTPRREVKRTPKTIGLDTGCVYGGALSAAMLAEGEWTIVTVRARRAYAS